MAAIVGFDYGTAGVDLDGEANVELVVVEDSVAVGNLAGSFEAVLGIVVVLEVVDWGI